MRLLAQILASTLFVSPVLAQDQSLAVTDALGVTEPEQFAEMAATSNLFEIHASSAALHKATSPVIIEFAGELIVDQKKTAAEMEAAAEAEGAPLPSGLDQDSRGKLANLAGSSGEAFDYAFLAQQWESQEAIVALFAAYSENGEPGPLKEFAEKTLPTLRSNLSEFQMRTNQLTHSDLAY